VSLFHANISGFASPAGTMVIVSRSIRCTVPDISCCAGEGTAPSRGALLANKPTAMIAMPAIARLVNFESVVVFIFPSSPKLTRMVMMLAWRPFLRSWHFDSVVPQLIGSRETRNGAWRILIPAGIFVAGDSFTDF
jgi:hypothetical protein